VTRVGVCKGVTIRKELIFNPCPRSKRSPRLFVWRDIAWFYLRASPCLPCQIDRGLKVVRVP